MAILIKTDGTQTPFEAFTLAGLQQAVGGFIEVAHTPTRHVLIINEEGKIQGLPHNALATKLYAYGRYDAIVGDVVLLSFQEWHDMNREDDED